MFDAFINNYEHILHNIAELMALTLELIGIVIVTIGSIRALVGLAHRHFHHKTGNVIIELGRTLSIALEFKMGAEIIKTVIVHDLTELAVLGIVILIRALLAFLIHWEIKMEKNNEKDVEAAPAEKSE